MVALCTNVDGKVIQKITKKTKSSQSCPICGLTPSQFKSFNKLKKTLKIQNQYLLLGLTPMHTAIRIFEFFIRLGSKMTIKANTATPKTKQYIKEQEKLICELLKQELGINVNVPKTGGVGNSNTGNIAKTALRNYKTFGRIIGVNPILLKKIWVVLCLLNQPKALDVEKLENYLKEIERMYFKEYSWKYPSVALHRFMHHTADVIRCLPLPPGYFSEQAGEARNKNYRNYR